MKSIMKKCFLLIIVLGTAILLVKNCQVDPIDQICQTDYTRMNYMDGYYYYQSSADHFYLYKSDGKRSECLAKQVPKEIYLNNNWIYFTNASDGQTLYKICTDGSGMKQVLDQKIDRFILLEDEVYYISGIDGYLYSWQKEAGNKLLYQGNCSWVNTDGKLLYVREQKLLENKDDAISWDYRGFHDFHIKNGKIFIKEWIAEGKGEFNKNKYCVTPIK